ncbi:protein of unknown function (plasmid) [Cupriavidus neocaledonicus]|uniref:Uncharacterized protein n=1 Tax=Cupriavidus neocaledonicus TaxID=1040979 RepID=A0A375HR56_9BURK|nr:protein of unknown function [Cupriavidus neocaledonicus]
MQASAAAKSWRADAADEQCLVKIEMLNDTVGFEVCTAERQGSGFHGTVTNAVRVPDALVFTHLGRLGQEGRHGPDGQRNLFLAQHRSPLLAPPGKNCRTQFVPRTWGSRQDCQA